MSAFDAGLVLGDGVGEGPDHGVLAPNAQLRPLLVPQEPAETEQSTAPTAAAECEIETFMSQEVV